MNLNPNATHLQIHARLPRSSAPESAPGYGSTLLKVELQSRKVSTSLGIMTPYLLCARIDFSNKLQGKRYWKEVEGS